MTFDPHANFAASTVATAPSPAASGNSLVVHAGDGAKFPASGSFNVVICPAGAIPTTANAEIARCTNVATDTLTITRAQEGTSARTVLVGDQIFVVASVKVFTDIESLMTGPNEFNVSNLTPATDITIPAGYAASVESDLEIASGHVIELASGALLAVH